jgi:hypothetical protein
MPGPEFAATEIVELPTSESVSLHRPDHVERAAAAMERLGFKTRVSAGGKTLAVTPGRGALRLFAIRSKDASTARVLSQVLKELPGIIDKAKGEVGEDRIEELTKVLLRFAEPDATTLEIERANSRLRAKFLEQFPCLGSREVHIAAGSRSKNEAATAHRWKAQRRIFSVLHAGRELFPAFQFQEGRPRASIGAVLEVLPKTMTPWQIAFWFVSGNGWLGDRAPGDCLDDAAAVVAAARHESETVAG